MAVVTRVDIELSAGVWTDFTRDVLDTSPIRATWGIPGNGPLDLLAAAGRISLDLDNSAANSGKLQGYYSPGHSNVRAGFGYGTRIRLYVDAGNGVTKYPFLGTIDTIAPTPGAGLPTKTTVVAYDWMGDLAETEELDLALQESKRSDELMQELIDLVERAPENTDIDTGIDTYPISFDDLGGTSLRAPNVAQAILQSERGYLTRRGNATDGETVRFENRHARALTASLATFTDSDLTRDDPITVPTTLERVFNEITTVVFPRKVGAAAVVLVKFDVELQVGAGETVTLWADFRDPDNEGEYIGGKDPISPTTPTDYTANDTSGGGGVDISASIGIVATLLGSRAKLVITNNHATATAYVRGPGSDDGMQVRGKPLTRYQPLESRAYNDTGIGKRPLSSPLEMPYQGDRNIGQGIADFLANTYGTVANTPTRVRVFTEDDALLQTALPLDIGDRVTVSESVTGVDAAEVFINGVEMVIPKKNLVQIWFNVAPGDTSDVFILDDAVAGVLDTSRIGWA